MTACIRNASVSNRSGWSQETQETFITLGNWKDTRERKGTNKGNRGIFPFVVFPYLLLSTI